MATHEKMYDLCIVGAGLMGSAAARHATLLVPELKVCLIGPKEPKDMRECTHGIFASHYDEGRIATVLLSEVIRVELAKRSMARYRDIEQRTGIDFYKQVGHIVLGPQGNTFNKKVAQANAKMSNKISIWDRKTVQEKYPYLSVRKEDDATLFCENGGHVSPRKLVDAQQTAAHFQGCDIFNDVVDRVTEVDQPCGGKYMKVSTANGGMYRARKVLLTPGAFIGFRDLLPPGKELDLTLYKHRLFFVEISENDVKRLREMPTLVWKHDFEGRRCYILPPIKYPDGKYYIKIGQRTFGEPRTAAEVAEYFKQDPSKIDADQHLLDLLLELVKDLEIVSVRGGSCVTTHTPNAEIYCDMITPTLGVATGGNGYSAMSSDEIGRMAARMIISGKWDHDLPKEKFRAVFKTKPKMSAKL